MKKILIVAGDKSGDLYGGFLSKKLKAQYPNLEIFSFAGEELAQYSRQIINLTHHSVSGLFEVVTALKEFVKIFKDALANIDTIKPDLIILIDFPDFNLRLAKSINKKIPVFYYVSPQVWAWRASRIRQIRKYVDKMIVIFKFEQDFYKKHNIDALYFGHPLLEIIGQTEVLPKKIISFLPGSRKNEVAKHLPVMLKAKRIIENNLSGYSFRLIRPHNLKENLYKEVFSDFNVVPHSYRAIAESEFVITSSGTATVEIAILTVPFLVMYKVNPFTWLFLKRLVNTEFVAMVNILASKKIIDELLQENANPQNVARIACYYLRNKDKYNATKEELRKVRETLMPYGATKRVAEFIASYLSLS